MSVSEDLVFVVKSLEKVSKRLRKVEVISRSSSGLGGSFIALDDTPDAYAGHAGWNPVVDGVQEALEFQILGGACVTFVCGPIGWRAVGGSPTSRTLIHEDAFQLDTWGDPRGEYAIDLQLKSPFLFPLAAHVAAGEWSVIFGGEENIIGVDCFESSIRGDDNELIDWSPYCHIIGDFNYITDGVNVTITGSSNDVDDYTYVFMAGCWNNIAGGFGLTVFGEGNDVVNGPDYSTIMGLGNEIDCWRGWGIYLLGEMNEAHGSGATFYNAVASSMAVGFYNHLQDVDYNYLFGYMCKSYDPYAATGNKYYDSRMVLNGDEPNAYVNDATWHGGGYNQASWFSQNEYITDWTVAWITSRFEFPIIQESTWGFIAVLSGTELNCGNVYRWRIEGLVKNAGGVTSIVWSLVTNLHRDVATKEWQVIADDPNDRLVFQFRDTAGPDATDCNIEFSMQTIEVGYD